MILEEVTDVLAGKLIDFGDDGAVRGILFPKRENLIPEVGLPLDFFQTPTVAEGEKFGDALWFPSL